MGVYAPHFKRGGPSQKEFFADLGTLLKSFSSGSQVMVVGYFNARLGRAQPGLVGKWSIHNRFRQTKGGDEMVALVQEHGLCAGSTFFQPGKNSATSLQRWRSSGSLRQVYDLPRVLRGSSHTTIRPGGLTRQPWTRRWERRIGAEIGAAIPHVSGTSWRTQP